MRALVLSGGGLFGAWQAGAWRIAAQHFQPDLIVGASIGSINGYLIAAGMPPEAIEGLWRDPQFGDRHNLQPLLRQLTKQHPLRRPLAITVTDLLRMKMSIYRDQEITWRHLAASCAIPVFMPQIKLDGRWYSDGGLFAPLPLWAAVELGATDILAFNVLAEFPSKWVKPAVQMLRFLFGPKKPAPPGVKVRTIIPSRPLGGMKDTLWRTQTNIDGWLELGARDAIATFGAPGPPA